MIKNISSSHFLAKSGFKELLKIMKICLFFLFTFTFQLMSINSSAQDAVIKLRRNSTTVSELINEIEKQTDYLIVYSNREVDTKREVNFQKTSNKVSTYLDEAFSETEIGYDFENNYIILSRKIAQNRAPIYELIEITQQTARSVTGKVTDENGEPVIGATIVDKENLSHGTITDIDGNFTLVNLSENTTLHISYVGMESQDISLNGRTSVNVVLKSDIALLEEVVVVGYGVQKKVNLTGSVATINFSDQIENRPVTNVSSALSGLAAGVNVRQGSGQPGSDGATIRVRGNSTFNTNDPLVLVDGIEWNMNNVNPNDIENISVLKDASSTAIYGTRAANGVILITTKSGGGKPQISYSYSGMVQKPYNELSFVNDYARYMGLVNEASENVGTTLIFSQTSIDAWRAANADPYGLNEYGVPNYVAYPNTNWFNEIFNTGYSQQHNLSVSGGNEQTKYLISLGFLDNQGIMNKYNLDSSTQKIDFRTNVESKLLDWLTVGTRLFGGKQDYGMANISNGFNYLYQTTPGVYPGTPNYWGSPALASEESSNANNIFGQMAGATGFNYLWRLNASLYAIISPFKGMSIESTVNHSPTFTDRSSYSRENGYWNYVTDTRHTESALENATITNTSARSYQQSAEILARYNTAIKDDHEIAALAGFSSSQSYAKSFAVSRRGATDWELHEIGTYETLEGSSSSSPSKWGLISYFGRLNYSYKQRYLFEANLRADASSRFGEAERWGYFPSFSAGWRPLEENFAQGLSDIFSNLKIRASVGQTGNHAIGNYAWQANYAAKNVVIDGEGTKGLIRERISNDKLQWETTTTSDIGLEVGFFNNKLTGEFDYYNKNTTDILYYPELYLTMGVISPAPANLGNVRNRGFETTINWEDQIGKDFKYRISTNFSYNTNKIVKFKGELQKGWNYDDNGQRMDFYNNFTDIAESGFGGYLSEGRQLGETYLYKVYTGSGKGYTGGAVDVTAGPKDGMIRTEKDMNWVKNMIASGYTFAGMSTVAKDQLWYGDLIYADSNENGNYGDENDREFSGHTNVPKYNVGLNFAMSYKNFDFSMVWSGAFGFHLLWNTNYYNSTLVSHGYGIIDHIANDHYFFDPQNQEDSRTNTQGRYPRLTYGTTFNNRLLSNWYEYRGDYLKLKNVQIGYSLPQHISRKFFGSSIHTYVSIENILTLTNYPGLDPEIGTSIGYPLMRQISFGGQITF